ncbi:MAG: tyrosine-type recombinase/integrase [Nitrospinota bacterium]
MSEGSKLALKFQMVTAQRKGEILTAKWSEFVIKKKRWAIPSENTKNGLPTTVPLSSLALKLLKRIKVQSSGSNWLFPSRNSKDKHVAATGVDNALRRNLDILKIKDFVPHDLRRTAATYVINGNIKTCDL